MELIEHEDRWSLVMPQAEVTRLCFDWAVTVTVGATGNEAMDIRIGGPAVLTTSDSPDIHLVPEGQPVELAPLLGLVRREVVRTEAFKDGRLEIEFTDGGTLTVAADEAFEPWELVGPAGERIVSGPGRELAVWHREGG